MIRILCIHPEWRDEVLSALLGERFLGLPDRMQHAEQLLEEVITGLREVTSSPPSIEGHPYSGCTQGFVPATRSLLLSKVRASDHGRYLVRPFVDVQGAVHVCNMPQNGYQCCSEGDHCPLALPHFL
ncbi:MAG: hypothetical protein C4337_10080 [Armatimonadota bacterium]